jgi:four helix bundle protein
MTVLSYRDLKVWQRAMDLAEAADRLTHGMPPSGLHGMMSQIRRSAVSVPANIAEGYGRDSTGSYIQFLKTARGSLRELETHVLLAKRVGLVDGGQATAFVTNAEEVGKVLSALIASVQRSKVPATSAQRQS